MKKGLVIGKFMPLHTGHLELIKFAKRHSDIVDVVLCHCRNESIDGDIRHQWLLEEFKDETAMNIISFSYDKELLSNSSVSSRAVSQKWALALKHLVPDVNIVFTSERYGSYLGEFMGIDHCVFDEDREIVPISATMIREDPFTYWPFIAESARSYFIKKIVIVGTESTGKSTLTEKLASYYQTSFVREAARDIIEKTEECLFEDLSKISELHAQSILAKTTSANKLLFVDTDLITTKSYSKFLFNKELIVEPWIEAANSFDTYLFLEPDCKYIQDGTRISESERNRLSLHHERCFAEAGKKMISINGNWESRFRKAVEIIDQLYFK